MISARKSPRPTARDNDRADKRREAADGAA